MKVFLFILIKSWIRNFIILILYKKPRLMMVTVELSKGQNTIQRKLKIKLTNIKKKQKKKNIQVVS